MKTKILFVILLVISYMTFSCVEESSPQNNDPKDNTLPSGELLNYSGCGDSLDPGDIGIQNDKQTCAEYSYENGVLTVKHTNAYYNCCTEVFVSDFTFEDGSIIINTEEQGPKCYCICPYELTFRIKNLKAGIYQVKLLGEYQTVDNKLLDFSIDINEKKSGKFCLDIFK